MAGGATEPESSLASVSLLTWDRGGNAPESMCHMWGGDCENVRKHRPKDKIREWY